jgi:DNA-binding MarR family transcriptional regulator
MEDLPDLDWLIEGMLPLGIIAQLFGAAGEGKSHVLLDLALTVAQLYTVIYLAAEDELQYKFRLRAWCQHHGVRRGQLHFWNEPLNLFIPAATAYFLREVAPIGPALIILDPLAQCGTGGDLDNTRDMTLAVEGLHIIRKATGATVLVCHHTGWSGDHERGSSVLRGAARTVYKLTNDDGLLKMTCEKMNNAPKPDPRYFRLMDQGKNVVLMPSSRLVMENTRPSEKQIQILESLQLETLREASFAQLLEYTEQRKSTLHHSLSRLIKQRYVEEIPSQSRKLYRLTTTGRGVLEEHNAAPDESGTPSGPVGLNWAVQSIVVRPAPAAAGASYTPPESHTTPEETEDCPVVRCESGASPEEAPEVRSGAPPYRGAGPRTVPDDGMQGRASTIDAKVAASKTVQRAVESIAERAFEHAFACVDDAPSHLRDEVEVRILFLIRLMGDDDHPEGWEWRSTYLLERQRDGYRTWVDVDRTRVVVAALRVELTEAEQEGHFEGQSS